MGEKKDNLDPNRVDMMAALFKGLSGVVPFAGTAIGEIVGSAIPQQRIDRIVDTMRRLQERLDSMDASHDAILERLQSKDFLPVVEEIIEQASRAGEEQRRQRLAEALAKSLTMEEIENEESIVLLTLLRSVSEAEIIWLKFYALRVRERKEFFRLHEGILTPASPALGGDLREVKRKALKDRYVENLESLGLLSRRATGSAQDPTHLGHMFLEFIDPEYSFFRR